ncbi:MAG: hypothetical protein ACPGVG_10815 [Mycobacterium sp.]
MTGAPGAVPPTLPLASREDVRKIVREEFGKALTAHPATKFFDALAAADKRILREEDRSWAASFAPPVTTFAACPCGSTFEIHRAPISLSEAERQAANDALGGLDVAQRVIDAINTSRDAEDAEALQAWHAAHERCEVPA